MEFSTDYKTIIQKLEKVDPIAYGRSRNHINGAVTYLSPYISRGVISTKMVLESVVKKGYRLYEIEQFVKELCWRDYFQRVGQTKDLNYDIKQKQEPVLNDAIPTAVLNAETGINGIDEAIVKLYKTGYMHNHCRMYTASLVCNIAKSHWQHPAAWLYYHLLDGDWASNTCSWQWVAAANSSKKYFANQENINKYTNTAQRNTYLDHSYEALETMETPKQLAAVEKFVPHLELPAFSGIAVDATVPTFIYNYYNLDPLWHQNETGNRVLLIEPNHFLAYPVSKMGIDFMLNLGKNIPNLQVYVGSFDALKQAFELENICYKEHPLNIGYVGREDARDWICPSVSGYYPSFFAYWKAISKHLLK